MDFSKIDMLSISLSACGLLIPFSFSTDLVSNVNFEIKEANKSLQKSIISDIAASEMLS